MRDVYVISSCRTAVGTFGGTLRDVPAADLGATVIAEALKRGNVKGEWLDEVMSVTFCPLLRARTWLVSAWSRLVCP